MPCKQRREPTPVSLRVSPIERVRAEIDDLFGSDRELAEVSEGLARLGVCLLMQIAIEAEVTEFLGRHRYRHSARARPGSRNRHSPTTVKTTAGPVAVDPPKLRGTDDGPLLGCWASGCVAQRLGVAGDCRVRPGIGTHQ